MYQEVLAGRSLGQNVVACSEGTVPFAASCATCIMVDTKILTAPFRIANHRPTIVRPFCNTQEPFVASGRPEPAITYYCISAYSNFQKNGKSKNRRSVLQCLYKLQYQPTISFHFFTRPSILKGLTMSNRI
jgi:hypothetical protein